MRVDRHRLPARARALPVALVLLTGCGMFTAQCQPRREDRPPRDDAPPCGSVNVVADDFEDDVIAPCWSRDGELEIREQDGQLEIFPRANSSEDSYAGVLTKASMSLRDSALLVQLAQPASADHDASACLHFGPQKHDLLSICQRGETLAAVLTSADVQVEASTAFSTEAHRFWQLRETDGQTFHEVSPDAETWELLAQHPTPDFVDYGQIMLEAGTGGSVAAPRLVAFDNLNQGLEPAVWCPSSQLRDGFDGPSLAAAWKVQTDGQNPCTAQIIDDDGEGRLQLSVVADQRYDCAVASTARYSLDGDSVTVCIVDAPTAVPEAFTGLMLWLPGDHSVAFGLLLDQLWAVVKHGQDEEVFVKNTEAADRACLRVSGGDAGLRFEARLLTAGSWELIGAYAADLALDEVRVGFSVNHWGPSCCDNPLSLTARFDHYNQD